MPTPAASPSAPTTLDSVKAQFAHWRATRTKLGKIPEHLWEAVIPLTKKYSHSRITAALGINCSQLQHRLNGSHVGNHESVKRGIADFVEVVSTPLPPPSVISPALGQDTELTPTLELTRLDGTTLKATGLGHDAMLSLVERFLGGSCYR